MGSTAKLSFRNARGFQFQGFEAALGGSWSRLVATFVNSDQPSEVHRGLAAVPSLKEWVGARRAANLSPIELTVRNKAFESTVPIHDDDLREDKTGQVRAKLSEQGAKAAELPEQLCTAVLEANSAAYDGVALYADRSGSKFGGRRDNRLTKVTAAADARVVTGSEMQDAIFDAIANIYLARDTEGDPLNGGAKRFVVMAPVAYMKAVNAALRNDFAASLVTNGLVKAIEAGDFAITKVINPRLTAPVLASGMVYVLREDTFWRALVFQARMAPNQMHLGETSDHFFQTKEHLFGIDWSGNAASALPEMTSRIEFKNA